MRRLIAYSFLVEAVVSIVLIVTFKRASDLWGPEGFGAWTLARRILSFALPLTTVGMEVSLPTFIARNQDHAPATYLAAGVLVAAAGVGVTSIALFAAPGLFSELLFGDASLRTLLAPLWGLLLAYSIHIVFFAFMRGRLRIMEANMLHLWAFGMAPLLTFSMWTRSPEQAMSALAASVAAPPATLLAFTLAGRPQETLRSVGALSLTLAGFGSSRMASALGLTVLALLPPLVAAQLGGLPRAGAMALGVTLIGFAGTLTAPIALTLLPATARSLAAGDVGVVRAALRRIEWLAVPVAGIVMVTVWFAAPMVAEVFLPSEASLAAAVLRVASLGAGSYALFSVLRPILDAASTRPRVLQCTLAAGLTFVSVWWAGVAFTRGDPILIVGTAYTGAMATLAVCAYAFTRAHLARRH